MDAGLEHRSSECVVHTQFSVEAQRGKAIQVDKLVAIYTSRDRGVEQPLESALEALDNLSGFEALREASSLLRVLCTWAASQVSLSMIAGTDKLIHVSGGLVTTLPLDPFLMNFFLPYFQTP